MKERLFDLIVSCRTLQEYTDAAAKVIHNPFWIMNSSFSLLAWSHHPDTEPYLKIYRQKNNTIGHVQEWIDSGLYSEIEANEKPVHVFDEDFRQNLILTDIHVRNQRKARVTVFAEHPVSDETIMELCRGASVYLRNEELSDNAGPMEYLLSSSLNGTVLSAEETKRILNDAGLTQQARKYRIACASADIADTDQRMASQAVLLMEARKRDPALTGVMFSGCAVFLETENHFLHPWLTDRYSAGYSWYFENPGEIAQRYQQARYALEHGSDNENSFDACAESYAMSLLGKQTDLHALIMPKVLACMEYDREWKTEYFHTLEVYMACGESKAETSRKLMLHLNTVKYRLKQMEELFEIDFDRDRELLQLSMSVIHYQKKQSDQL